MKKLLNSSMILVAAFGMMACDGNDDSKPNQPGWEVGNQNLGRSAAMCISQGWQGGQQVRRLEWTGDSEETLQVSEGRGPWSSSVFWNLKPASRNHYDIRRAEGQLVVQQGNSELTVRSALGGFVNLNVASGNSQNDVNLHCVSNAAFRRDIGNQNRISCRYRSDSDRHRSSGRAEVIYWDGRPQVRELSNPYSGEFAVLRLKEGGRMEVEVRNPDSRKTIRAESLINEGLEIRYRSRAGSSNFSVSCGAASK